MKHIKSYKIYESSGWNKDINWKFVKENPDDKSDESSLIVALQERIEEVILKLDNDNILKIIDINGDDLDYGAYAIVSIFDEKYEITEVYSEDKLFIDKFPINNMDENDAPGYLGYPIDISDLLNLIYSFGGMKIYQSSRKYNI